MKGGGLDAKRDLSVRSAWSRLEQNKETLGISMWTMNPVPFPLASAGENVVSL